MSNIYDYLKWRGDLSMRIDPFNDIDGLILSELVYVDFDKIVPTFPNEQSYCLKDVANNFSQVNNIEELLDEISFTKESITLLQELAKCPRYQNILLSNYINELDYQSIKQFEAITFQLEDSSIYVAFRGTDDTILGWREDFQMTYQFPVASQQRAVEYLAKIAEIDFSKSLFYLLCHCDYKMKWYQIFRIYITQKISGVKIRVGGHSKGGNLAVYASSCVNSKISKRIIEIYNNDSPGFNQKMLNTDNYRNISTRIKKFIPESSVFGIMLENLEEKIVVKSSAKGLMQHSGFSWSVEGTQFVCATEMSKDSQTMDAAFKSWLSKVDSKTRKDAVTAVFSILEAAKIEKINDFSEKSLSHLITAIKEIKNMNSDTRNALIQFFKTLIVETYDCSRKEHKKKDTNENNS